MPPVAQEPVARGASHAAAGRAVEAGYTDVSVMVDGTKGWKALGKPTVKPAA